MNARSLASALFAPRTVALVGASGDPAKNTSRPQRYLRKHGYRGRILPINRERREVLGEPAYLSLSAAPGSIDHAFIMVPARAVPEVIAECCTLGIPLATIYSDGFAEAGEEGRRRQERILEMARSAGLRLLGPNSMGVVSTGAALALTVNAALEAPALVPGGLALISQSGTVLGALLSRGQARGIGFSKLVSVGNEADLTVAEIGEILIGDPDTQAILLFLETLRDGQALAAMAHRAFAAGKPVIAYRLGRSAVGRELARSHSGAMTGAGETVSAFLRTHGILQVELLESLLEAPVLVIGRKPTRGRRAAMITTTGGGAAMVADRLGAFGLTLVPPPASALARLQALGVQAPEGLLLDVTMAGARPEVYGAALAELLRSPECDLVVAVVGSSGQFHPQVAVEPILSAPKGDKPLAVFIAPHAECSLELLAQGGVAAFRTPEACADAVRAFLEWQEPAAAPARASEDLAAAERALASAKGPVLDEWEARTVFEALGIPQAPAQLIASPGERVHIGYPLAAKVLSADIAHKTEAGGVVLDIEDDAALAAAVREIRARVERSCPGARMAGILVQRMERGLLEAIVGYKHDREVGPIVLVGMGGTLAEIYRDFSLRLAPVDLAEARAMIEEVKGFALIRGYRSLPRGDCEALARAVCALSRLAQVRARAVLEAEINPLVVKAQGEGAVAVDRLIVCRQ
jgi:acyl-CoA synthetase (NDP forming)